jgi:hypothetical protein
MAGWSAFGTDTIGDKDLVGLLQFRNEQAVEDVVKSDIKRLPATAFSHACRQKTETL